MKSFRNDGCPAKMLVGVVAVGAVALTAACGSGAASGDAGLGSNGATVKVGTIPVIGQTPLFIGIEQGFFKEQGLTVTTKNGGAFDATLASVLNGESQVGFAAAAPATVAASKGAPIQVAVQTAANARNENGDDVDVVDPSIKRPHDLEGKTVGVRVLGGLEVVGIQAAVSKDGGDPTKVKFVEVPEPQKVTALKQLRVAAVALADPFASIAAKDPKVRKLFGYVNYALPANAPLDIYYVRKDFAAKNPDVLKRFATAMDKAVAYANQHPESVRSTLVKIQEGHLDPEVAKRFSIPSFTTTVDAQAFTELQKQFQAFLKMPKPVSANDFFAPSALQH